jgi:cell division septum initiation protein DivIVA
MMIYLILLKVICIVRHFINLNCRGKIMEIRDYCKAMLAEVNAWKEKLEALKKVADNFSAAEKEKISPLIGQIEQEVAAAQARVDQLGNECPADWSPMKEELDDLFGTVGDSVDRAWRDFDRGWVDLEG